MRSLTLLVVLATSFPVWAQVSQRDIDNGLGPVGNSRNKEAVDQLGRFAQCYHRQWVWATANQETGRKDWVPQDRAFTRDEQLAMLSMQSDLDERWQIYIDRPHNLRDSWEDSPVPFLSPGSEAALKGSPSFKHESLLRSINRFVVHYDTGSRRQGYVRMHKQFKYLQTTCGTIVFKRFDKCDFSTINRDAERYRSSEGTWMPEERSRILYAGFTPYYPWKILPSSFKPTDVDLHIYNTDQRQITEFNNKLGSVSMFFVEIIPFVAAWRGIFEHTYQYETFEPIADSVQIGFDFLIDALPIMAQFERFRNASLVLGGLAMSAAAARAALQYKLNKKISMTDITRLIVLGVVMGSIAKIRANPKAFVDDMTNGGKYRGRPESFMSDVALMRGKVDPDLVRFIDDVNLPMHAKSTDDIIAQFFAAHPEKAQQYRKFLGELDDLRSAMKSAPANSTVSEVQKWANSKSADFEVVVGKTPLKVDETKLRALINDAKRAYDEGGHGYDDFETFALEQHFDPEMYRVAHAARGQNQSDLFNYEPWDNTVTFPELRISDGFTARAPNASNEAHRIAVQWHRRIIQEEILHAYGARFGYGFGSLRPRRGPYTPYTSDTVNFESWLTAQDPKTLDQLVYLSPSEMKVFGSGSDLKVSLLDEIHEADFYFYALRNELGSGTGFQNAYLIRRYAAEWIRQGRPTPSTHRAAEVPSAH